MDRPAPDLMSELLQGMRLRGIQHRRIRLPAPFCLDFPDDPGRAQFHFIAGGEVVLQSGDGTSHTLAPGAAVLLPHGCGHRLVSPGQPASPLACRDIRTLAAAPLCEDVAAIDSCPGQACGALLFSSCMELELGAMQGLVRLMPPVMLVTTLLDRQPELLPILTAMEAEARAQRLGHAAILARLADVVAATILRGWVESGCGQASGLAEAMRDPRLARALAALHREPGRAWTVAELAAEMGSSRSIFAERFQAVTGISPLRYVTELRMRLAQQWIGRERLPIEQVASRLGYASQAAFSRAFKRVTGQPPGAVRSAARRSARRAETGLG
ncbi:AraC family transcriptional regulator [Roseomonas sp. USHLN139]|uniref:AraC family transcriptional regulator n=1 Tax=Roseomonas sp. USHLN139 TaxID=3081298 RepID=UPI003B0242A0